MCKNIVCPLCQSNAVVFITNKVRFDHEAEVYRCQACTLTFLNQDSFKFPNDFYEKQYHQTYLTHVEPDALDPSAYFSKMKQATAPWAKKFSSMLKGHETIIDIGCSTGHFIDIVRHKTDTIYGMELNEKEIDFCRNTIGLDVSNAPLEKRFKENTFDYITLIYVLEHIAKPIEFLTYLKRFLKSKGKIVILVPNIEDPLVSFYDIAEFKIFYYCIEHLFYYNKHTMYRLLTETGLKGDVEVIQEYPITNHLSWIYRRRPSETLTARKGVPDILLAEGANIEEWSLLWDKFNSIYKQFLNKNGYGDRLWCVVGKD
ncbi:methyltransferase domain protein [Candidatus Magnetobacterium bavaricum]|uniref:Methyltransferase domain protein n=1 Tax=Candidatus Magnetobacterium bavaricum TaxID=29290 RepID=A0A0F3GJE3_9BACT|nr:methyltransferase domain protein [Candidatus Magnetobacterium bavaricum]